MENIKLKAPWWFWVIGGLYLLWNAFGCYMYVLEHLMSDADYGELAGSAKLAVRDLIPVWATAGHAVGVWGGLIGIILFLLRKKICLPFFYASFAGAIIGWLPSVIDSRFSSVSVTRDYILMSIIWVECLVIIWIARKMRISGILT